MGTGGGREVGDGGMGVLNLYWIIITPGGGVEMLFCLNATETDVITGQVIDSSRSNENYCVTVQQTVGMREVLFT